MPTTLRKRLVAAVSRKVRMAARPGWTRLDFTQAAKEILGTPEWMTPEMLEEVDQIEAASKTAWNRFLRDIVEAAQRYY